MNLKLLLNQEIVEKLVIKCGQIKKLKSFSNQRHVMKRNVQLILIIS